MPRLCLDCNKPVSCLVVPATESGRSGQDNSWPDGQLALQRCQQVRQLRHIPQLPLDWASTGSLYTVKIILDIYV